MKVILTTESGMAAVFLKRQIISAVKGETESTNIDTWSYTRSGDNYDILYHNPEQYTTDPNKNVLFRVEVEGPEIVFSSAWWQTNPQPTREMICLHTGRITEMLLTYFSNGFIKLGVADY